MKPDFVFLISFFAIGAMVVYFGYYMKQFSPYKSNFPVMGAGFTLLFVGLLLFAVVPIAFNFFSPDSASNLRVNSVMTSIGSDAVPSSTEFFGIMRGEVSKCEADYCFRVSVESVYLGSLNKDSVVVKTKYPADFSSSELIITGLESNGYFIAEPDGIREVARD